MTDLVPRLRSPSPETWLLAVQGDFNRFLLDHACAERKASAMAISFVVQYPDRPELHLPMIRLAREELLHFQQVTEILHQHNIRFERDEKDPYVSKLIAKLRTTRDQRLLDRLLMGSVIEARGVERFSLVSTVAKEPFRQFYKRLARSEQSHAELFPRLALNYFDPDEVRRGLDTWLDWEAEAIDSIPVRAALH